MSRLSEKYIAGFLDADGTISMGLQKDCRRFQLMVQFSQKATSDEVLKRIRDEMGGAIRQNIINGKSYSILSLCGVTAKKCLNRISKYLVIKSHYANMCMEVANKPLFDKKEARAYLRKERQKRSEPLPNFPSRKWLAGYFDGDGCLSVTKITGLGKANLIAHIACSHFDTEGIEIIHKAFGGAIHDMRNGSCRQWALFLNPSKAKKFLGYFAKHSIVKRDQNYFVLGCAEMGHYRDGKNIKSALKHLKAQEQRLSDSGVASLLGQIRDLEEPKRTDYKDFYRSPNGKLAGKLVAQAIVQQGFIS